MKKELQAREFARNTSSVLQRDAATVKADDEEELERLAALKTGGPAFFL